MARSLETTRIETDAMLAAVAWIVAFPSSWNGWVSAGIPPPIGNCKSGRVLPSVCCGVRYAERDTMGQPPIPPTKNNRGRSGQKPCR